MLRISRTYPKLALVLIAFLFVIILVSLMISSSLSASAIRKEATASSQMFLNRLDRLYGNELDHINVVINQFCKSSLNKRDLGTQLNDQYERYLLYSEIDNLLESNRFLQSVCVYVNNGRDVYHQSAKLAGWEPSEEFHDTGFYNEFLGYRCLSHVTGVRTVEDYVGNLKPMAPVQVISCAKRLPALYFSTDDAVVFNVYADYLSELAGNSFQAEDSGILLLDAQSGILLSHSQRTGSSLALEQSEMDTIVSLAANEGSAFSASVEIGGEKQYVIGYQFASGRTGIVMTPEALMLLPVTIVSRTLLLVAACLFAFGIVFSAVIDRRYFQPVQRILRLFANDAEPQAAACRAKKPGKPANEFIRIESYIGQLTAKNREQEKQLQSYFTYYRTKALQALIGNEAGEALADERLFFGESTAQYCIVLACPVPQAAQETATHADGMQSYPENLADALSAIGRVDVIEKSKRRTTLLYSADIIESTGVIRQYILERCPPGIYGCAVALGGISTGLAGIHESFDQAEQLLHRARGRSGAFTEEDLAALTRNRADGNDARKHLPTIDMQNIGSDNIELISRVMHYIAEHYMEDIGLNTIAEYVYFSPSYLGKLFKDVSGYNFTDYIIKVRMESAAMLLLGTSLKMNEVMRRVGYFSVQGFSRVFKNHFGCSPGEYRKKAACNALGPDGEILEQVSSE